MSRLRVWQRDMAEAGNDLEKRLAVLKTWADVRVAHRLNQPGFELSKRRGWFLKKRGLARRRIGVCGCCWRTRQLDRHHVIQLQNGGHNGHLNIIDICRKCHTAIHPWMARAKARAMGS